MKNKLTKCGIAFALMLLVTPINIQALSEESKEENQMIEVDVDEEEKTEVVVDEEEFVDEDLDLEEVEEEPDDTVDLDIETNQEQENDTYIPDPEPTPEPEESLDQEEAYDETTPEIEDVIVEDELDEEVTETESLILKVNIYSNSEDSEDEKVHFIETINNKFSYQYTLPKYLESFRVDVETIEEDVVTVFESRHTISKDMDSVLVSIEAGTDKQYQVYQVEIFKNDNEPVLINVGGTSLEVYDEKDLDAAMKSFGFTKEILEKEATLIPYFKKDNLSLTLLTQEGNAMWYLLNDKQQFQEEGILYVDKNKKATFILNADKVHTEKTINSNPYIDKDFIINNVFDNIGSNLKFKDSYKSWDYSETSEIVYGKGESGDLGYFMIDNDSSNKINISFDQESDNNETFGLILSAAGLLLVFLGMTAVIRKKRKKPKNIFEVEGTLDDEDYVELIKRK